MNALVFLLIKSMVIFGVSGVALLSLRRASAASRHLVCLLTLAALFAMPVLTLALPGWQVLPGITLSTPDAPMQNSQSAQNQQGSADLGNSASTNTSSVGITPGMAAGANVNPSASFKAPQRSLPWSLLVLCVWAIGFVNALGRPALGLWGIRSISQLSEPVKNMEMLAVYTECVNTLGLPRRPELRQTDVPVPMTWSSLRPVIMLPSNAETWPQERQRSVFLHEMAHVRRHDWLSHRLADLTCAVYWFHPLAWITARSLRAEGEAACDDLVLTSGVAATEYARHLLEIARGLSDSAVVQSTVAAMAQTSEVSGRLKRILDKGRDRRIVTRRDLLSVLIFAMAALLALVVLRPVAQASAVIQRHTPAAVADRSPIASETPQEYKLRHAAKHQFILDAKRYNNDWVQLYDVAAESKFNEVKEKKLLNDL